ncbi:hypothetical protein [Leptolyngbya ohadii]|uniref:hypothetical protein n=1 Tax=Leptolyngbya ohadii TaxID=1962290 RepID=UPI000B5A2289|nr:hypothetical protein [Leptolyngbya ohadii]
MAKLQPRQSLTTEEPRIEVDAGLPPGRYRIQLVVVNDRGQESLPDVQTVVISNRGGVSDNPGRPNRPR